MPMTTASWPRKGSIISGLRTAVTFLTRIPIGDGKGVKVAESVPWFPFVGALIGAIAGGVHAAAWPWLGPGPAAALALVAGALVTGAFHHDGLADIADAFGGGWTTEQRLVILKDSRHGTYGVMSLVLVVATQLAALVPLGPAAGFAALVAAGALGRAGAVSLMRWAPPARQPGLGADYGQRTTTLRALAAVAMGAAVGGLAMGPWVALAIVAVAVTSIAVAALAVRKIAGVSGDVLGAAEVVGEAAVLLVAASLAQRGVAWPWWV